MRIEEAARQFLAAERIAVVGVSRDPNQAANLIYRRLRSTSAQVFAVNPAAASVEGDRSYPGLDAIPGGVGAVLIATRPEVTVQVVRDCVRLGIRRVWMHRSIGPGSVAAEAVAFGRANGVEVIDGGCPMMFIAPVDVGHRCMRVVLGLIGAVPRRIPEAGGSRT